MSVGVADYDDNQTRWIHARRSRERRTPRCLRFTITTRAVDDTWHRCEVGVRLTRGADAHPVVSGGPANVVEVVVVVVVVVELVEVVVVAGVVVVVGELVVGALVVAGVVGFDGEVVAGVVVVEVTGAVATVVVVSAGGIVGVGGGCGFGIGRPVRSVATTSAMNAGAGAGAGTVEMHRVDIRRRVGGRRGVRPLGEHAQPLAGAPLPQGRRVRVLAGVLGAAGARLRGDEHDGSSAGEA